jgi:hypothetical protein
MKRLFVSLALVFMLGGCAMYASTPAYYDPGGAVYVSPPPVYAAPRVYGYPRYAGPPVFLHFGYNSWDGRHSHRPWGWSGHGHRHGHGYWHGHGGRYRGR